MHEPQASRAEDDGNEPAPTDNNPCGLHAELRRRGLSTFQAAIAAGSPTACWRMARHVAVQQALRNHHFDSLGLPRLYTPAEA